MHGLSREKIAGTWPFDRIRPAGDPAAPTARGRLTGPSALLAVIALCYALAQFFLITPAFGMAWDEAVYASQFSRNGAPIAFHASRSWGTPLVLAPVVAVTNSVAALRVYLIVLSSLLLFGAFRTWLPLRPGYTVPVAAALFAGCWPTVLYGNQAMPNMFTALGAVALTGLALNALVADGRSRWAYPVAAAGAVVATSLFRSTDTMVITLSLAGTIVFVLRSPELRRRALTTIAALAAGLAIGWGLWTADSIRRYGSIANRLELATEKLQEYQWLIDHHLRALDGPITCSTPDSCGPLPTGGLVWMAGLLLLAAVGLASSWRRDHRVVVVAPFVVAACIAGAYLYYGGLVLPRYMLPAYGLMSITVAVGLLYLVTEVRRRTRAAYAAACCGLLVGAHLYSQTGYLVDNVGRLMPGRAEDVKVAAKVERIGYRKPCLVYGWHAPQIGHYLGCEALGTAGGSPLPATPRSVLMKSEMGYSVMAVYRDDADAGAPELADWREQRLTPSGWRLRVNDGEAGGGRTLREGDGEIVPEPGN